MKRFLKTLLCMALPLTLSACSFGQNGNTSSSYKVVSKSEATNYANSLGYQEFGEMRCQYKTKVKSNSTNEEKTGDTCEYNAEYYAGQQYWSITTTPMQDQYLNYSTDIFLDLFSFERGRDRANSYSSNQVRYSIDEIAQKIKIEIVNGSDYKLRLEYDNTLNLRASLLSTFINGGLQTLSLNAKYSYKGEPRGSEWLQHDYQIELASSNTLMANCVNQIRFEYYCDGVYSGLVNFYEFFDNGVIRDVYTSDGGWGYGDNYFEVYINNPSYYQLIFFLYDGSEAHFNFTITPNYWDAPYVCPTEVISRGQATTEYLFRTSVRVNGFVNGFDKPTEYGSFVVIDDYQNNFVVDYSTFREMQNWLSYENGQYYCREMYSDFYTQTELDHQFGNTIYPDSLMIGDGLEIIYSLKNNGEIAFAYIVGWGIQNRFANKMIQSGTIASAFEHSSTAGEGKYMYQYVPMRIKSYYSTYSNPSSYGRFIVTDLNGDVEYTVYGSTFAGDDNALFRYNNSIEKFTFTNPKTFLNLDFVIGDYQGNPIYPRDLKPGDIIYMNFITATGRINGNIVGWELSSREPVVEPEPLSLTLPQIFERTDGNSTRLYYTTGYISSFSSYGMYVKFNIYDETNYYIYSATFDTNCFTYNPSTGLYSFSGKTDFGANHGTLRVGDKVDLVVTRNDYQGQPELIGYVSGYYCFDDCYSITSASYTIDAYPGNSFQLNYDCLPAETRLRAAFSSSDINIASVDNNGVVYVSESVGGMSATITVQIDASSYQWIINVLSPNSTCTYLYSGEQTININVGSIYQLDYVCEPSSTRSRATYYSYNPSIAEVKTDGCVYGVSVGSTTVVVSIDNMTWTWTVKVDPSSSYVQSITSDYSDIRIYVGDTFQLAYTPYPAGTGSEVYFNSNDTSIVTVDAHGLLIGQKSGATTVYVTIDGVFYYWTVYVMDVIPCERIESSETEINLNLGSTYFLSYSLYPSNTTEIISFYSYDDSVATVGSEGLVSAVSYGSTTIVGRTNDAYYYWTINVQRPAPTEYCESITSDHNDYYVSVGETFWLNFEVSPASCASRATFYSTDSSIASVDSNGLVTALLPGQATIIMTIDSINYSWVIHVNDTVGAIVPIMDGTIYMHPSEVITLPDNYFTVAPSTTALSRVTYSTGDSSIIIVTSSGVVHAIGEGTTYVRVEIDGLYYSWTVVVEPYPPIECQSITSPTDYISIGYGEGIYLEYTFSPAECDQERIFTTSDPSIAPVDSSGLVIGTGCGSAVVTLTIGSVSYSWTISVYPLMNVEPNELYLNVGDSYAVAYSYTPSDVGVYFWSQDENIATVSDYGAITAVAPGDTIVYMVVEGFSTPIFVHVS